MGHSTEGYVLISFFIETFMDTNIRPDNDL